MPANAMPIVSSVVAIGRAMNGALMFIMVGKVFFFEKKKQKTFDSVGLGFSG
jgi:hypothetical protein